MKIKELIKLDLRIPNNDGKRINKKFIEIMLNKGIYLYMIIIIII